MPGAKCDTSKEGPLFTSNPVFVLVIVRIVKQRVEREERESVDMGVPWERDVQRCVCNFSGHNRYFRRDPTRSEEGCQ